MRLSRLMRSMPLLVLFAIRSSTLMAAETRTPTAEGLVYGVADGQSLTMDYYAPKGRGIHPIAILIHGGGFDEGSRSTNTRPLFDPLANAGFAWFSNDYRLAPEAHFPDAMADVDSAIRWLKTHSAEYRVDPAPRYNSGSSRTHGARDALQ